MPGPKTRCLGPPASHQSLRSMMLLLPYPLLTSLSFPLLLLFPSLKFAVKCSIHVKKDISIAKRKEN
jgi:hypothetical protein